MQTVLVTGGAGYIGSHTVAELVNAGYRPVIVDNFSNSDQVVLKKLEQLIGQPVTCYEQDFQDIAKMREVVKKEKATGLIHFAAFKQVGESVKQPLKYYQNNVAGLIKLLAFVEDSGITNFVFSSSCTVYGNPDHLPVTEDSPVKPAVSPYGATKQMAEIVLHDATGVSENFSSIALRYFNPIGAHPSALIGELPIGVPANLIPYVTQTAAGLRDKLTVFGDDYPTPDGSCIRDYIHVVDLARAHVSALKYLENKKIGFYDVVNVGTGTGSSVLEVIKTFEKATGQKLPYQIGPRRSGDVTASYASVDKAKKVLNWRAGKTLADALTDAWRWQKTL